MTFLTGKTAPYAALAGSMVNVGEPRRPTPAAIHDGAIAVLAALWRTYCRRRDRRHLGALPEQILKDIGISQGENHAAVAGLRRRELDRTMVQC